ncbi:MAG: tetratricopeptide repeat protein [Acidobacteriota bacterium]
MATSPTSSTETVSGGAHLQNLLDEPLVEQAAEPGRELTVEEAIDLAIQLQRQEHLDAAAIVYREIRRVDPDNARAMHYAGVLDYQAGRSESGIDLMRSSLAASPGCADWHNNLAIALKAVGRLNQAIAACQRAIALNPGHYGAYSNLGVLLRETDRPEEAESAYRTAIRIDPSGIDAYTNLGILLNGLQRTHEAVACFCKVITLRPKHPEARKLLALAHCAIGEVDEAVRIFQEWLAADPDDPVARHMLPACTGEDAPLRASDAFVESTFDSFAGSFEAKLARLSYRAPRLIATVLENLAAPAAKQFDVLDAGCGTGLCGPLVAAYARTLIGVDLSSGMLAQAREKQVYDDLLRMELTAALLSRPPASLDVIVSADTLVYFGDLSGVAAAAARVLRPGGWLIFTLERGTGEAPSDFHLEMHGRYTHAQAYVERVLREHGLLPAVDYADLRMESGLPVAGLVVRGWKSDGGAQ